MDWLLSFFLLRVPEVTTIARRSFICFGNSLHLTFCVGCVCVNELTLISTKQFFRGKVHCNKRLIQNEHNFRHFYCVQVIKPTRRKKNCSQPEETGEKIDTQIRFALYEMISIACLIT